jgi:hypothetical protein
VFLPPVGRVTDPSGSSTLSTGQATGPLCAIDAVLAPADSDGFAKWMRLVLWLGVRVLAAPAAN